MTKTAYGYLRVSGPDQVNGDGFPRQRAAIEAWAAREGVTIAGWYQEQVQGWRDSDERAALAQLFEDAEGGAKIVVFETLQRLARDLMIQESIIADMKRKGLTPISATEGAELLSDEPSRVLFRQMMGAFNQYDKAMIVAKLKAARGRVKLRTGRCEGQKPYGRDEGERAVIDRIRELREQQRPMRTIAEFLNLEGAPTRKPGTRWSATQVMRVLRRMETN